MSHERALRHNKGKLRYDLVDPYSHEMLVKVLTWGTTKYDDNNWRKGENYSVVLASLKRHLAEFEKGEDIDKESKLPHVAHMMTNLHFLGYYTLFHPECDDRFYKTVETKKEELNTNTEGGIRNEDEIVDLFTYGGYLVNALPQKCENYHPSRPCDTRCVEQ